MAGAISEKLIKKDSYLQEDKKNTWFLHNFFYMKISIAEPLAFLLPIREAVGDGMVAFC